MNGKAWVDAFGTELDVQPKIQLASKFIVTVLGLFNPIMKEFAEMLYQWDRDYVFDSSKIERQYKLKPTEATTAIKNICAAG